MEAECQAYDDQSSRRAAYERDGKPRGQFFHSNWTGGGGGGAAGQYTI